MPKITKREPRGEDTWGGSPQRKNPAHDLNQPHNINKKKNTKRWCRGKVGVEHHYELTEHHDRWLWFHYDVYTCARCGKRDLRSWIEG